LDTEKVPLGLGRDYGYWKSPFWVLIGTVDTERVPLNSWILSNRGGLEFYGKPVQNHYGMNSLYTFGKLFHGLAFFGFCSTLGTGGTWGSCCYEHGF